MILAPFPAGEKNFTKLALDCVPVGKPGYRFPVLNSPIAFYLPRRPVENAKIPGAGRMPVHRGVLWFSCLSHYFHTKMGSDVEATFRLIPELRNKCLQTKPAAFEEKIASYHYVQEA